MLATENYTKEEKQRFKEAKAKELEAMNKARQKDKELMNNPDFDKLPGIKELLKEIRLPNKIEVVRDEDFVIRSFLRHGTISQITRDLNERHKDTYFINVDVTEFIQEYKDAINKQISINKKGAMRRIMKTKEGLTHELLDLAEFSKELAKKYDDADDHTSAISAIKAAADIFYRNAKLEGLLDEGTTINITTQMDKLVENVTNESSRFKEAIMKVVNSNKENEDGYVEAEFEEVTDA